MLKIVSFIAAASSLLLLQGCTMELSGEEIESQEEALTSGDQINSLRAALAVAEAMELGEIDPVAHFEVINQQVGSTVQQRVVLKSAVQTWCKSFANGCSLINDILSFQDDRWITANLVPQSVLSPNALRSQMVSDWGVQNSWEINLRQNTPWLLPDPHVLQYVNATYMGGLGIHYVFSAYKDGCQLGSAPKYDVKYRATNTNPTDNQGSFSLQIKAQDKPVDLSGITLRYSFTKETSTWNRSAPMVLECYGFGKGCPRIVMTDTYADLTFSGMLAAWEAVEGNFSLHLSDWCNINESNDASFLPSMTSYGTNPNLGSPTQSCVPFANTEDLKNRMRFFGDSNPYLDIRVDGNSIAIDPDYTDTTDGKATAGSCTQSLSCTYRDPDWSMVNTCCSCYDSNLGKKIIGKWQVVPWNTARVYCKAG